MTITQPAKRAETTLPHNLMGYTFTGGKYSSFKCRDSSTWQTSSSYGRCCPTSRTDCFIPTGCVSGSVMVGDGDLRTTCSGTAAQTSCITGTIYHSISDQKPIMNYQCWPLWARGNFDATIITSTSTPSPTSSSTLTPSSTVTSTSSPQPTSVSDTATKSPNTRSHAWIAGPVLGAVLGAVLFTLLGIWIYRRHAKKAQLHQQHAILRAGDTSGKKRGLDIYGYNRGHTNELMNNGVSQGGVVEMGDSGLHEVDGSDRKVFVEADGREVR